MLSEWQVYVIFLVPVVAPFMLLMVYYWQDSRRDNLPDDYHGRDS